MSTESPPAAYRIGEVVWSAGDAVTITTAPYTYAGGRWQDGTTEDGRRVCLPTPLQKEFDAAEAQAEHRRQQDGFRRLRELQARRAEPPTPDSTITRAAPMGLLYEPTDR